MRKNSVIEQNRRYHLVSRLAHRAFFLDDEEKDRAVALMRRVEAGVQAIMSYCINRAVSISPFALLTLLPYFCPTGEIYIIEFKLDRPASEAMEQIKGKEYAGEYALSKKRITLIGISFSSEKRTIVEELVEELKSA